MVSGLLALPLCHMRSLNKPLPDQQHQLMDSSQTFLFLYQLLIHRYLMGIQSKISQLVYYYYIHCVLHNYI